jgi:hypothetical protein
MSLDGLQAEHALLAQRLVDGDGLDDAVDVWRHLGIDAAAQVPDLDAAQVGALRRQWASTATTPAGSKLATLHEALT